MLRFVANTSLYLLAIIDAQHNKVIRESPVFAGEPGAAFIASTQLLIKAHKGIKNGHAVETVWEEVAGYTEEYFERAREIVKYF